MIFTFCDIPKTTDVLRSRYRYILYTQASLFAFLHGSNIVKDKYIRLFALFQPFCDPIDPLYFRFLPELSGLPPCATAHGAAILDLITWKLQAVVFKFICAQKGCARGDTAPLRNPRYCGVSKPIREWQFSLLRFAIDCCKHKWIIYLGKMLNIFTI
jgi:hypothetical protein